MLAALRIGEFTLARRTASSVLSANDADAEALTLSGDALWAAGFFDEADREYARALAVDSESSARARFGIARSLSSRSRLNEALSEVESRAASWLRTIPICRRCRGQSSNDSTDSKMPRRRTTEYADSAAQARVSGDRDCAQPRDACCAASRSVRRSKSAQEDANRSPHPAVQAGEQQDRRPRSVERCAGRVGARYRRGAHGRVAGCRERRRNPHSDARRSPPASAVPPFAASDWAAQTASRSDR